MSALLTELKSLSPTKNAVVPTSPSLTALISAASKVCSQENEGLLIFDVIELLQQSPLLRTGSAPDASTTSQNVKHFLHTALLTVIQESLTYRSHDTSLVQQQNPRSAQRLAMMRQVMRARDLLISSGGTLPPTVFNQLVVALSQCGEISQLKSVLQSSSAAGSVTDVALVYAAEPLIMSGQTGTFAKLLEAYWVGLARSFVSKYRSGADERYVRAAVDNVIEVEDEGARIITSFTRVARATLAALLRRTMSNTPITDTELRQFSNIFATLRTFVFCEHTEIVTQVESVGEVPVRVLFKWPEVNRIEAEGILWSLQTWLQSLAAVNAFHPTTASAVSAALDAFDAGDEMEEDGDEDELDAAEDNDHDDVEDEDADDEV